MEHSTDALFISPLNFPTESPIQPVDLRQHRDAVSSASTVTRLGHAVIAAHEDVPEHTHRFVAHNFLPGPKLDGSATAIIPHPAGDIYLQNLSIPALGPGETALGLPALPKFLAYCRDIGLLDSTMTVVELPAAPVGGANSRNGFPYYDVVSRAFHARVLLSDGVFVSAFTTDAIREQASALGAYPVQQSDSSTTNNKAEFRRAAEYYGYPVASGAEIRTPQDIINAADQFAGASKVWLKLDRGSGGDMVMSIDGPLDPLLLLEAIQKMREVCVRAFNENSIGDINSFWPDGRLPIDAALILETDVRDLGPVVVNGSNMMLINESGEFQVLGTFRQRTGEQGEYLGSEPYVVGTAHAAALDAELAKVAAYAHSMKLFGIVGIDFFLLDNPEKPVVLIELNGRPPISATAKIIGDKLEAEHWINVNLESATPITSMTDYEAGMTIEGVNYARGTAETGLVVPQAFRTLCEIDSQGETFVTEPSRGVKVLICAPTSEECDSILSTLVRSGKWSIPTA